MAEQLSPVEVAIVFAIREAVRLKAERQRKQKRGTDDGPA